MSAENGFDTKVLAGGTSTSCRRELHHFLHLAVYCMVLGELLSCVGWGEDDTGK